MVVTGLADGRRARSTATNRDGGHHRHRHERLTFTSTHGQHTTNPCRPAGGRSGARRTLGPRTHATTTTTTRGSETKTESVTRRKIDGTATQVAHDQRRHQNCQTTRETTAHAAVDLNCSAARGPEPYAQLVAPARTIEGAGHHPTAAESAAPGLNSRRALRVVRKTPGRQQVPAHAAWAGKSKLPFLWFYWKYDAG